MDVVGIIFLSLSGLWAAFLLYVSLAPVVFEARLERARRRKQRAAIAPLPPSLPVQPWPHWVPPGERGGRPPRLRHRPRGTPVNGVRGDGRGNS